MTRGIPYPEPSSPAASATMRANRRTGTKPELALRRELHARGLRYRVDHGIRTGPGRLVRPDIVFPGKRLAVFVDGCFWHGCAEHRSRPRSNQRYWQAKVTMNVERDRRTDSELRIDGWRVLRVWEHEDPGRAADRIAQVVR